MLRSRLLNQYLTCKSEKARTRFKIQRNLWVTFMRKTKHDYYGNLDLGELNDSKKFWNTVKPVYGDEVTTKSNSTLIIGNKKK